MMDGKVYALKRSCFSAANTRRSSHYERHAAALNRMQSIRLQELERLFFASTPCTEFQKSAFRTRADYTCALGRIWYYLNKQETLFILLDFELFSAGGGGLPHPCNDNPTDAYGMVMVGRRASGRRISAFNASWFGILDGCHRAVGFPRAAFRWASSHLSLKVNVEKLREFRLYPDLKFSRSADDLMRVLDRCWASDLNKVELPEWSVLSPFCEAPEQLDNYFARSIVTGELLSLLAMESSARANVEQGVCSLHPLALRNAFEDDEKLLAESKVLLKALCSGEIDTGRSAAFEKYAMPTVLGGDWLGDDRMLHLIQIEILMRLSSSIYLKSHACRSLYGQTTYPHKINIMRRYALLSRFAAGTRHILSNSFRIKRWDFDDLISMSLHGQQTYQLLGALEYFDNSTAVILARCLDEFIVSSMAFDELEVQDCDLFGIASELLSPLSDEPPVQ